MYNDIDLLVSKAPNQTSIKAQLPLQGFFCSRVHFDIEVDIASTRLGISTRAKQPGVCIGAKDVMDFFHDGLNLLGAEAYWLLVSHLGSGHVLIGNTHTCSASTKVYS